MGWGWEVWCNPEVDRRPRGRGGETDVEGEKHIRGSKGNGGGGGASLSHSTHRSHLSPSQAVTVKSPGAGGRPVGAIGPGGSRCRGHCLREASQGCGAVHDAGSSGAAHRTGEVRRPREGVDTTRNTPTLSPRRCPRPAQPTCPPVCIELSGGTEGSILKLSLRTQDCEKCPIRDSRCMGRRVQREETDPGLRSEGQTSGIS